MVGSIFIPVLLATSLQNERLLELSGGGLFVVVIIGGKAPFLCAVHANRYATLGPVVGH